jgi:hypothetical protein
MTMRLTARQLITTSHQVCAHRWIGVARICFARSSSAAAAATTILICVSARAALADSPASVQAITHATVIDPGSGPSELPEMTILIVGDRIVAVGPTEDTPCPYYVVRLFYYRCRCK